MGFEVRQRLMDGIGFAGRFKIEEPFGQFPSPLDQNFFIGEILGEFFVGQRVEIQCRLEMVEISLPQAAPVAVRLIGTAEYFQACRRKVALDTEIELKRFDHFKDNAANGRVVDLHDVRGVQSDDQTLGLRCR